MEATKCNICTSKKNGLCRGEPYETCESAAKADKVNRITAFENQAKRKAAGKYQEYWGFDDRGRT